MSYSVYRGDGKRAWKQSASGSRTYFFYDGDTLIGTSGDAANSASVWLWGADGLIGTQTKNAAGAVTSGYYLYDAQGNLAQTVSGAGVVTPVAAYTAWGEVVPNADGTKPTLGSLGYGAKFGYWRDADSGLYLCTLRFYNSANGRFITRDPIGFAGGSNLFGYTGNDPGNRIDPSGLDWFDDSSNFSAGWGDALTFGATKWGRRWVGEAFVGGDANEQVNYCSGAYFGGEVVGTIHQTLLFAGGGSAGVRASLRIGAGETAVLWSGGEAASKMAGEYAATQGGRLLTSTIGGKIAVRIANPLYKAGVSHALIEKAIWTPASRVFVQQSRGPAIAFLRNPRAASVFFVTEEPTLQAMGRSVLRVWMAR